MVVNTAALPVTTDKLPSPSQRGVYPTGSPGLPESTSKSPDSDWDLRYEIAAELHSIHLDSL